jgi:hypothetical protein
LQSLLSDLSPENSKYDEFLNEYKQCKNKYEEINDTITMGAIVRSRTNWHEYGEKSSKLFLGLEKSRSIKKHMKKLKISESNFTTDQKTILKEQKKFYKTLYNSNNLDMGSEEADYFFDNQMIPKIPKDMKARCEGLLLISECKQVVDNLNDNKTPGNDGICGEFYKTFWEDIANIFIDSINFSHTHGEMSTSQRQAVIILIPKKDKDQLLLKNWRPISLINVDCKIASKSIAKRLDEVLPTIIHFDQTGYVKGRNIRDAIRSIFDIMHYTKEKNIPGLLLFLDFEKAFDRLEHNYLFKCLERFGFGTSFIRWVSVFYSNISSCTINNGYTSGYFDVTRGVRQGDPLSAYLFIIGLEICSIAIRSDKDIHGIVLKENETKLIQYADDSTVALADVESAERLFLLLKKFQRISGLKVNIGKSEGMWIGSLNNCSLQLFEINWSTKPILALGVYFTKDSIK